jgi:hypothetical protein
MARPATLVRAADALPV